MSLLVPDTSRMRSSRGYSMNCDFSSAVVACARAFAHVWMRSSGIVSHLARIAPRPRPGKMLATSQMLALVTMIPVDRKDVLTKHCYPGC
jgi:hypothetical protein